MTETQKSTNEKRLPYRYVLHYRHREHWSIYGNVHYGTETEGELERLQQRAKELALINPHLKYWVDRHF